MSLFDDFGNATRAGFQRVIRGRQAQANRQIRNYLHSLDEKTLARLGYGPEDLKRF